MVDVREEWGGLALFATKAYSFGDTILNEEPLIVLDGSSQQAQQAQQAQRAREVTTALGSYLRTLHTAFNEISTDNQNALLDLFCPCEDDLQKNGIDGNSISYADLTREAELLCTTNVEAVKLTRLFCIWKCNSTQYQGSESAVFKLHARINHSCCPNAIFQGGTVRALTDIKPGDSITISYLEVQFSTQPTHLRRKQLMHSFQFFCKCKNCVRSIDLTRTMRCSACQKCSVVWGLSLEGETNREQDATVTALCVLCSTVHSRESLPLTEEAYLEKQVENLEHQDVQALHALHARALETLGGAHWIVAALMQLRYDKLQWGEAYAKWTKLALIDMLWMYYMTLFAVGNCCKPHLDRPGQQVVAIAGRRYWHECYEYCKKMWGSEDQDVKNMESVIAQCRDKRSRMDVIVCANSTCTKPIEIREGHNDPKKACVACGLAHYCNKSCQQEDWKSHKELCKACRALRDLETVRAWIDNHFELVE